MSILFNILVAEKESSPISKPNLILNNANVITLNPKQPLARFVALKGDRIVAVGMDADPFFSKGKVIDCEGRTVVPGFHDAHCHVLAYGASLLSVDCSPAVVSSVEDIKRVIRERAEMVPPGAWIRAFGYNEFYLAEKRHPTRWDLDEAAPHHPVKLTHRSGHACVLNSMALSLAGISIETPDPPGGIIERDLESGEPNGLLYEMEDYLSQHADSALTEQELLEGIKLANAQYLAAGITSLQDATVSNGRGQWQFFRNLREGSSLKPRLRIMLGFDSWREIRDQETLKDASVPLGAVKIVLDETTGELLPAQKELNRQVLAVHRAGHQVAIHAIEENAVEAALIALENAVKELPRRDHRHRVEHCSVCPDLLLNRLKKVGAIIVTQPSFIYYNGDRYLAEVPQDQQPWLYNIGSFLRHGLRPAASSDSPVVPVNPLVGVYSAVTRRTKAGQTLLPEQSVSPLQALGMYIKAAAYASFEEQETGSIAVGKRADLVILSQDPTAVPVEEIKDISVEMTIAGGEIVWSTPYYRDI